MEKCSPTSHKFSRSAFFTFRFIRDHINDWSNSIQIVLIKWCTAMYHVTKCTITTVSLSIWEVVIGIKSGVIKCITIQRINLSCSRITSSNVTKCNEIQEIRCDALITADHDSFLNYNVCILRTAFNLI